MLSGEAERLNMNKKVLALTNAMEKAGFDVINLNTKPVPLSNDSFAIVYRVDFQVRDKDFEVLQNTEEFYLHILKTLEDCQN